MCYRRDQSHAEWDFDLIYQNGETAAVEVTSSHNQALTQIHSEIFSPEKGGSRIQAVQCKFNWFIRPIAGANINTIRKKADRYLAELEAKGIFSFNALDRPQYGVSENLAKIRDELQLEYGKALSPSDGAEIRMQGTISGGAVGPTTAIRAAENEFEPNRKKLEKSGCAERHLFINVDQMNGRPWVAMVDFHPPEEMPRLPQEITHVWLASQMTRDQFVVWSGSSNRPWQRTFLEGLSVNS